MISSPNRSNRNGARVIWVVIHTAEGARTVTDLGNYFARTSVQASSHVGIDDHGVETYVPYSEAAWTIRAGNTRSDNAELCGFAAWTRNQWITEHGGMLKLAAAWIRERCLARGIPIAHLTPADVAAGRPGVIGHIDYTLGAHDGTHTDPGPGFPWDVVMQLANTAPNATPTPAPRPAPAPAPRSAPEDAMYIKCQPKGETVARVAIWNGPIFMGLGSASEIQSAEAAIAAGATVQWVELATWNALDRVSHQLCDPHPTTVALDPAVVAGAVQSALGGGLVVSLSGTAAPKPPV